MLALALCQARYWTTVEPQVRELLARYSARALGIADPIARDIALDKLKGQRMHAQAAATFATLAHRPLRGRATAAIVALEALYDYVDGLTERPIERDSIDDQDVVQPFIDAFAVTSKPHNGCTAPHQAYDDGDYTGALVSEVQHAFSSLPSAGVVNETVTATATRFAEAQVRVHLATHLGHAPLKQWATVAGDATGLDWREYSAGAISSVVGAHALIAAAADPRTTADQARALDALYLRVGVVVTMLDSLIDSDHDARRGGQAGLIRYYDDSDSLRVRLPEIVREAMALAARTPNPAHHTMTLVGAVAFHTSAPTASSATARPICRALERELWPVIGPARATMLGWRLANRIHDRRRMGVPDRRSARTDDPGRQ